MKLMFKNSLKKLIKSKGGISPLIATVLIIGFTIALAAIIVTWGSSFVQKTTAGTETKTTQTLACVNDLSFDIGKVVCDNNGAAADGVSTVTVDNKGLGIKKVVFRYFDATGANTGTGIVTPIAPATEIVPQYEIKVLSLPNLMPAGSNKLEALATINIEGVDVTCAESIKTKTFTAC